jgi:glycosyltransferase involved in cell wall biosynthesis
MKLLMLNYEFPPIGGGAAAAHLNILGQYAGNSELQVHVLTSAPKPGFVTEKFADNITIYKIGIHKKQLHYWRKTEVFEWLLKAKSNYRKLLHENNYDLVHAFSGFPSGWLCYRSANKLPYIISLRGSDVPGENVRFKLDYKILGPVFKAIWKNAVALVACSEGLKNRASQFLPSVKIDVIPNGVDLDKFHPDQNKKTDTLRLVTVGRLSATKRVDILIDTAEMLCKDNYKFHLTIAGSGKIEQQLREIVSERKLDSIIEITGRIEAEDMPQLYRRNDIFISASMQEGMSNAMLEAMASGLPIVTTRCEGLEELITENGIVLEEASAKSLAQAVKTLSMDERRFEQMRIAARKRAEIFTWNSIANQYMELYKRILREY